jgi:hypothetical protein
MFFDSIIAFIRTNCTKGRRECFAWETDCLENYIIWAFSKKGLLVSIKDSKISGVAVVYPLHKPFGGELTDLLPSDNDLIVPEASSDLCVMDWIAIDAESRKDLIGQFQTRFPNWENQNKYGIQFGKSKLLTNKYMNILKGLN